MTEHYAMTPTLRSLVVDQQRVHVKMGTLIMTQVSTFLDFSAVMHVKDAMVPQTMTAWNAQLGTTCSHQSVPVKFAVLSARTTIMLTIRLRRVYNAQPPARHVWVRR